ncbi:hypothetical protein [Paenibacillus elgii]|uniref:hypothetical protein n=1 Tax=Paenibacillus elgii TaxID=189691 RepID=UPI0012FAAEF3|nr:hypothetical protein [Paenibacillus elgii]
MAERQCGIVWAGTSRALRSVRQRSAIGERSSCTELSGGERRERPGTSGRGRPAAGRTAVRHCLGGNVASAPERPAAVGQQRAEQQRGVVRAGTSRTPRNVRPRSASGTALFGRSGRMPVALGSIPREQNSNRGSCALIE